MQTDLSNIAAEIHASPGANKIQVLICKTNIRLKRDIKKLAALLNSKAFVLKWNIDTKDIDNVLRIETTTSCYTEVISIIKEAGLSCEELPD